MPHTDQAHGNVCTQAAVPKFMQLRLSPASGTALSPGGPAGHAAHQRHQQHAGTLFVGSRLCFHLTMLHCGRVALIRGYANGRRVNSVNLRSQHLYERWRAISHRLAAHEQIAELACVCAGAEAAGDALEAGIHPCWRRAGRGADRNQELPGRPLGSAVPSMTECQQHVMPCTQSL